MTLLLIVVDGITVWNSSQSSLVLTRSYPEKLRKYIHTARRQGSDEGRCQI